MSKAKEDLFDSCLIVAKSSWPYATVCPTCQCFLQPNSANLYCFFHWNFFFFVERVLRYSPVLLVSEIALLGDVETDRRRAGYPDNMAVASQHTGQKSNQT